MNQARRARTLSAVLVWTILGSLIMGFAGIWCMHFLGMLSCEFDLLIGLKLPQTILSAVIAVVFTYGALSIDLLHKHYKRSRTKRFDFEGRNSTARDRHQHPGTEYRPSLEPLFRPSAELQTTPFQIHASQRDVEVGESQHGFSRSRLLLADIGPTSEDEDTQSDSSRRLLLDNTAPGHEVDSSTSHSTFDLNPTSQINTLLFAAKAIFNGLTVSNLVKAFLWSIALTNMHFMGVMALDIPGGYVSLSPPRVILCAFISWSVCCVGVGLMAGIEANIKHQLLFSVVAATGVAAVHFSGASIKSHFSQLQLSPIIGMYACFFWTSEEPSSRHGYPIELPIVITSVSVFTCMLSADLLAHYATVALYNKKRLWAAIAEKKNAQAIAVARSEFIASASHEIRTPIHQLQGYADLLSKSDLSEEDRQLLLAIQHATRSLSMSKFRCLSFSRSVLIDASLLATFSTFLDSKMAKLFADPM